MTDRTYRDDPYEYMSQDPCDYCPYQSTDKCDEDNCSGMIMIDADQFDELPIVEERQHVECNQCKHYECVHGVQGHAPCSFWGIGGVLSCDYCSRFEKEGEAK